MSLNKPKIFTEADLKNEAGEKMMKLFLKDRGVPRGFLEKIEPGPALDQFYHLVCNHRMHWRDAAIWVNDHKNEILAHDRRLREANPARSKAD